MAVFAGHAPLYQASLAEALRLPAVRLFSPARAVNFVDMNALALRDVFQHIIRHILDEGGFPWTYGVPSLDTSAHRLRLRELMALILSPTRGADPRIETIRSMAANAGDLYVLQKSMLRAAMLLSGLRLVAKCFADSRQLLYHGWRDVHARVHALCTFTGPTTLMPQSARPTYFPMTKTPAHFEAQGEWFRAAVAWMFYPRQPSAVRVRVVGLYGTVSMDPMSCFCIADPANPVLVPFPVPGKTYHVAQLWVGCYLLKRISTQTHGAWMSIVARKLRAAQQWRARRAALVAIVQAHGMPWRRPPTKRKAEDGEDHPPAKRPRI